MIQTKYDKENEVIKKYPVTYKDKEYEIRIEDGGFSEIVSIYEAIKESYGLFQNKTRNNYERVYSVR